MRGISQIVVALLMIAAVLVATAVYGYLATSMLTTYIPSEQIISRLGSVDLELTRVSSVGYSFVASVKLINLGTEKYTISNAFVYLLIKGTTGKSIIKECLMPSAISISPGNIGEIIANCYFTRNELYELFGTTTPPADLVKKSARFLFLKVIINMGGIGGSPGRSYNYIM